MRGTLIPGSGLDPPLRSFENPAVINVLCRVRCTCTDDKQRLHAITSTGKEKHLNLFADIPKNMKTESLASPATEHMPTPFSSFVLRRFCSLTWDLNHLYGASTWRSSIGVDCIQPDRYHAILHSPGDGRLVSEATNSFFLLVLFSALFLFMLSDTSIDSSLASLKTNCFEICKLTDFTAAPSLSSLKFELAAF